MEKNDDIEMMRRELRRRYDVILAKDDPLVVVMAVNLWLVSECIETINEQNRINHNAILNELQKLRAELREKSYPRGRVENSSNIRPS